MRRLAFLIGSLLLLASSVVADEPRYQNLFSSRNRLYEASRKDDGLWHILEKSTSKELYSFSDRFRDGVWFSSMTLVVGDDGKHLVIVNDYGENLGERAAINNPEALFFFIDGKLTRSYKLLELIDRKFILFSVSHFLWLTSPNKLEIEGSKIEFSTFERNHFVFDIESGEQISKHGSTTS